MTRTLHGLATVLLALAALSASPADAADRLLRVCAEPDNLPHSHRNGTGFENRIAQVLADALDARLVTAWVPMTGRIVTATLRAERCDVLLGVPAGFPRTSTTKPYYRSTFVFVQRAAEPRLRSLADDRLAGMRIGVQRVRHDASATPPGFILAHGGNGDRLVSYAVEDGAAARKLVDAVASGRVDVAALWGPQAGYHVDRAGTPLQLTPIAPSPAHAHLPMEVAISLAVRPEDKALLAELESALERERDAIDRILDEYRVPRTDR